MVLEKIHKENDIKNLSPEELTMLADTFGFDEDDIIDFERNAIMAAFTSASHKEKLLRLL